MWHRRRQLHASRALTWAHSVFVNMLQRLWPDQAGASLIDYAIVVAVITVLVVVGIAVVGASAQAMWTRLLPLLGRRLAPRPSQPQSSCDLRGEHGRIDNQHEPQNAALVPITRPKFSSPSTAVCSHI